MNFFYVFIFIACNYIRSVSSVELVEDIVSITSTNELYNNVTLLNELTIQANGIVYNAMKSKSLGHFRYHFNWHYNDLLWNGTSSCIQIGMNAGEIQHVLSKTNITVFKDLVEVSSTTVGELFKMKMKRFQNLVAFKTTYHMFVDINPTRIYGVGNDTFKYNKTAPYYPTLKSVNFTTDSIGIITQGCLTPQCIRKWNDNSTWVGGRVPTPQDSVHFPLLAGVVEVDNDIEVSVLHMENGMLVGHHTSCPDGWSINPSGKETFKCYKLFQNASTFEEAEAACQNSGMSSIDSHLVSIRSRDELNVVKRLCRGNKNTPSYQSGCWIGLKDRFNNGQFSWQESVASSTLLYNNTFMDWKRYGGQPMDNITVSDGADIAGGSGCVSMVGQWQDDPLSLEQGSYIRSGCVARRPYLCQIYATTTKYEVNIKATSIFENSATMKGGQYILNGMSNVISGLLLQQSASLTLGAGASGTDITTLLLEDGCSLVVNAPYVTSKIVSNAVVSPFLYDEETAISLPNSYFSLKHNEHTDVATNIATFQDVNNIPNMRNSTIYIGERYNSIGMQSIIIFNGQSIWNIMEVGGGNGFVKTVTVNARVEYTGKGGLNIGSNIALRLTQGADLATAALKVVGSSSVLYLQGYSSRLSTYDAFELVVSHRGPVLGEYTYFDEVEDSPPLKGVYRLVIYDDIWNITEITTCIPYNATSEELSAILSTSNLIKSRGGVTIRRSGSGTDPNFGFGYTYRIEMDAPSTASYFPINGSLVTGSISISIYCYGIWGDQDCGCAQTKVPGVDHTGTPGCPKHLGNISRSDPDSCVIPPSLAINRLSTLSYTRTSGLGSLQVNGGLHRLPPISNITLGAMYGSGIVSASVIDWYGVQASGNGQIIMAGSSWLGWDSVIDLYFSPVWEQHRRNPLLNEAPSFIMNAIEFEIKDLGAVLTSCPGSIINWERGTWSGGVIGGRSTIYINEYMVTNGTLKALRYYNRLWIRPSAIFEWSAGNFSLSNGAHIIVEGQFKVDIVHQGKQYFGQASSIEAPDPVQRQLLQEDPGRNWNGYYDDNLPQSYRQGWYTNPACGGDCLEESYIEVKGNGSVVCSDYTNATFVSPLNLIDQTVLSMGHDNDFELNNGGICGDDVVMNIGAHTLFELSGGSLHMQATCTIKGAGELFVTGGEHDLGLSIDAHITIHEGVLLWPRSRVDGVTITFRGGLLIEHVGILRVEPWSTTIIVHNEVLLTGSSQILFPAIGIAGQPSLFDRADAPDESPRGNFTAVDVMRWESGTIYGKADIFAMKELYLSGSDKTIKFLAKLVNKGHCEWSTGNLITEFNGDFLNEGTLQMAPLSNASVVDSATIANTFNGSALYEGTIVPKDAGGDPFALNYHSWDSDFGHLSYIEYVDLRTEFVSRAPSSYVVAAPPDP